MSNIRVSIAALGLAAMAVTAGCYRPEGQLMNASGAAATYWSTETQPKTVSLRDLRSNEIVFTMDIPVGKQLVLEFVDGKGDDEVQTPDLMRYEVFDLGTTTGKLKSAMSVPNFASRRLEVDIRRGTEYAAEDPNRSLRMDEVSDRPDWWTAEGGELPEDPQGLTNYDD